MKGYPLNGRWVCWKCKTDKPISEYNLDRGRKNGHQGTCRECQNIRLKEIMRDPILAAKKRQQNAASRDKHRARLRPIWVRQQTARQNANKVDPAKQRCREILQGAVRYGRVIRSECCVGCGAKVHTHGHHEDYSKPYEVLWLCPVCHADVHRPLEFPRQTEIGKRLKAETLERQERNLQSV